MARSVVLLFSGGKDSMLACCRLLSQGYKVYLMVCNTGTILLNNKAIETAKYLESHFDSGSVGFAGEYLTYSYRLRVMEKFLTTESYVFAESYPRILPYQLCCLCCHSAMHLYALAYAIKNDIKFVATGARESHGFVMEDTAMIKEYESVYLNHNIQLLNPVFDLEDDFYRRLEIASYGITSSFLEPQCTLGYPVIDKLNREQVNSLVQYFVDNIKSDLNAEASRLAQIMNPIEDLSLV